MKSFYLNGQFLLQAPTGIQRYAYDTSLFKIKRYGVGSSHYFLKIMEWMQ